jgi:DNA invertase Pin-like site-specific DNA recombinase
LVVWKLDRLGRDLRHLVNIVHDLTERGIGLKVLTGQGAAIDTTTASGKLVFGDLCTELGISRQTVYRHVSTTGDLRPDGQRLLYRVN